jgi:hypothetical protein
VDIANTSEGLTPLTTDLVPPWMTLAFNRENLAAIQEEWRATEEKFKQYGVVTMPTDEYGNEIRPDYTELNRIVREQEADDHMRKVRKDTTIRAAILDEAKDCVCGDRVQTYGNPCDSFETVAVMWSAYFGFEVTAAQVAICQVLLKVGRLKTTESHHDSWVDICGYAGIGGECAERSV